MVEGKYCKYCAFFALSSEGMIGDRCRLHNKVLTRDEMLKETSCPDYTLREEEHDIHLAERKLKYREEFLKLTLAAIILVIAGIVMLYFVARGR